DPQGLAGLWLTPGGPGRAFPTGVGDTLQVTAFGVNDAPDHLLAAEAAPLDGRKRYRKKLRDLLVRHPVEEVKPENLRVLGRNPLERIAKKVVPRNFIPRRAHDVGKGREPRRV